MVTEKIERWVLYVLRATLVAGLGGAIFELNWSIAFITAATILLSFFPYFFERRYNIVLPVEFVLAMVIFVYAALFLGEVHGFYERFWWWDLILHAGSAIGFGLIGFIVLYILFRAHKLDAKPGLIALFSFAFALSIGALWEISEFSADTVLNTAMQKNGLHDTMWDLIVDGAGAFLASLGGYVYLRGGGNFIGRAAEAFVRMNKRLLRK